MNRFKASLLHLLGSGCALILVFALVRWIWYPGRLFDAASGAELFVLLVGVDLVLGPLITLIIFSPGKPSLKFDIVCVLAAQVAFLSYGVWSIYSARPVYMAFAENRFYLVMANEIDPADQKKATNPTFQSLPLSGAEFVGTVQPNDPRMRENIAWASFYGMGIQQLPQYFVPYLDVAPRAKTAAMTANDLVGKMKDASKEDLTRLLDYEQRTRTEGKNALFVRLLNKKVILFVAVDAASGAVLTIL